MWVDTAIWVYHLHYTNTITYQLFLMRFPRFSFIFVAEIHLLIKGIWFDDADDEDDLDDNDDDDDDDNIKI